MRKFEEDRLQVQVADYLRLQYPRVLWFHVPNGGNRNAREGARFKRMGVLPGVADITIIHNGKTFFVELKIKPNKQAPSQKDFERNVKNQGLDYEICYTFDEAKDVIDVYLT